MTKAKRKRIARLKNRISRTRSRLDACDAVKSDETRRTTLREIVRMCDAPGIDFEALVDDVADWLDEQIEPDNPILEWLSDVGIDIAAHAAVTIWKNTEQRLRRRLARDLATLDRLT